MLKRIFQISAYRTNQKILVIESDDWGFGRMPSVESYWALSESDLITNPKFEAFDTWADLGDLKALEDVLKNHMDSRGIRPVISLAMIMGNPDYDFIIENDFDDYRVIPFLESEYLMKQPDLRNYWMEEVRKSCVFDFLLHGRDHLNVQLWLKELKNGDQNLLKAFENKVGAIKSSHGLTCLAEFEAAENLSLKSHKQALEEAIRMFRDGFGRNPLVFIPPNGPVSLEMLKQLKLQIFVGLQIGRLAYRSKEYNGRTSTMLSYQGKRLKNSHFVFMNRNVFFEPLFGNEDLGVNRCLMQIERSFNAGFPAVISSHRVNYVNRLRSEERYRGQEELDKLLRAVTQRWPEVNFFSSSQLFSLITENKSI